MYVIFEILAIVLMFINVVYVTYVFISLKKTNGSDALETKKFNIIGYIYIAMLILFAAGYVSISIFKKRAGKLPI